MEINQADVVLCKFYFSDTKTSKDRPVLVFKDNLPHKDFVGIPLSSKTHNLLEDEFIIDNLDFGCNQ
jgi:mRNA interferase MazF